jgi:hypothetical protein
LGSPPGPEGREGNPKLGEGVRPAIKESSDPTSQAERRPNQRPKSKAKIKGRRSQVEEKPKREKPKRRRKKPRKESRKPNVEAKARS